MKKSQTKTDIQGWNELLNKRMDDIERLEKEVTRLRIENEKLKATHRKEKP